jgi:hypothetical protein
MNVVVPFYKLIDNNNELFNLSSYINMYIEHLFINNDNNNSIDINMVIRGGVQWPIRLGELFPGVGRKYL